MALIDDLLETKKHECLGLVESDRNLTRSYLGEQGVLAHGIQARIKQPQEGL